MISAAELIEALGGTNATARFFGVKPPSVTAWSKNGVVPDDKLVRKAVALERALPGRFSRVEQWGSAAAEIWPDLSVSVAGVDVQVDGYVQGDPITVPADQIEDRRAPGPGRDAGSDIDRRAAA